MKEEHRLELIEHWPELWKDCEIDCADGWFDVLVAMSWALSQLPEPAELDLVKEKFGGLRVHLSRDCCLNESALSVIAAAEALSFRVCQWCGEPGSLKRNPSGHLVATLCDDCGGRVGFTSAEVAKCPAV